MKERIPFLSPWQTRRFRELRANYHKGMRAAPWEINIDLPQIYPLLKDFNFLGGVVDASQTEIIVDITERRHEETGRLVFGQLENREPSLHYPCIMRLYGGSHYQSYLRGLETVGPDQAKTVTQQEIASTIIHERVHFEIMRFSTLPTLLWLTNREKLEIYRKSIRELGDIDLDEVETICEWITQK